MTSGRLFPERRLILWSQNRCRTPPLGTLLQKVLWRCIEFLDIGGAPFRCIEFAGLRVLGWHCVLCVGLCWVKKPNLAVDDLIKSSCQGVIDEFMYLNYTNSFICGHQYHHQYLCKLQYHYFSITSQLQNSKLWQPDLADLASALQQELDKHFNHAKV